MKRQKLILLLLVVGLISSTFEMPMRISASSAELFEHDEIQPRYTNLQLLSVSFWVDPDEDDPSIGYARAFILTTFYSNTKRILIKVEFERRDPDGWINLATAWVPANHSPADWGGSITVKHGYYYRAVVTVQLYDQDGNLAEKVTLPSNAEYF